MRMGFELPATIPGVAGRTFGDCTIVAEDRSFASVGVIDRPVDDSISCKGSEAKPA